ncbi:glutamyl-tRNA(Gln) amidotransferase subunit B, mitochondrial-like [Cyprinus carpio]|uniref:Glutamyl-tRNA(Gln) amidotransferase subunit B, mitochondrial-like n=1 Tax=Cyprinus carpio TaxID=7962 RepID=A0A9Q9ZTL4_CYPCA|nr:glutamyl-tRNA(Gln) amidotransferase subunit B, mitochondrial-like [Cyprinus carpio]
MCDWARLCEHLERSHNQPVMSSPGSQSYKFLLSEIFFLSSLSETGICSLPLFLSPVSPGAVAVLIILIESSHISSSTAKPVFQKMWKAPKKTVGQIVKEQDLWIIKDKEELQNICQRRVDSHPEEVQILRKCSVYQRREYESTEQTDG